MEKIRKERYRRGTKGLRKSWNSSKTNCGTETTEEKDERIRKNALEKEMD